MYEEYMSYRKMGFRAVSAYIICKYGLMVYLFGEAE